jgi:hypothetical protein
MPVRFGVEIPHRAELLGPVAIRAEALGFDSVWKQPFEDLARKYCLLGPPAACVDRLAEFVAAGVRTFVIYFTVSGERVLEQLERFGAEVVPHVPGSAGHGATPRVAWQT